MAKEYTDANAVERKAFLASLEGLEYSAVFVPQSVSRNAGEKNRSLNWRIRIARNGHELITDYMQGIGHVPGNPQHLPHTLYFEGVRKDFDAASETGRYPKDPFTKHHHEHGTRLDVRPLYPMATLPGPELEDVLHSLVLDASARDVTFDEWCDEYGYDTDSRKAHATYMLCADIGLRLVRILGGPANLSKLESLYQDF